MNQIVLAYVVIYNKIIKEDERKFLKTVISSHVVNESISLKNSTLAIIFIFFNELLTSDSFWFHDVFALRIDITVSNDYTCHSQNKNAYHMGLSIQSNEQ